ncbi:hypothetical protein EON80_30800 [bacterium]|nr:MAG: hypothetical protein EON80_30800 [bacterium]
MSGWHQFLQTTFATDVAHQGAAATASNTRGNDLAFAPSRVLDARTDTYWATNDDELTPQLTLDFQRPITFNVVRLREYLPLGQRVDAFAVDSWDGVKWQELISATSIGNARLLQTKRTTTSRVRLRITGAAACPAISELGLFLMPEMPQP